MHDCLQIESHGLGTYIYIYVYDSNNIRIQWNFSFYYRFARRFPVLKLVNLSWHRQLSNVSYSRSHVFWLMDMKLLISVKFSHDCRRMAGSVSDLNIKFFPNNQYIGFTIRYIYRMWNTCIKFTTRLHVCY
jgi:hypothetical protein